MQKEHREIGVDNSEDHLMISDLLKRELRNLSQDIACELKDGDAEMIAEVCMDANRLTIAGYPELDKEVSELISKHGYSAVLEEAAKHVSTW